MDFVHAFLIQFSCLYTEQWMINYYILNYETKNITEQLQQHVKKPNVKRTPNLFITCSGETVLSKYHCFIFLTIQTILCFYIVASTYMWRYKGQEITSNFQIWLVKVQIVYSVTNGVQAGWTSNANSLKSLCKSF